jgi:hypothetical protein
MVGDSDAMGITAEVTQQDKQEIVDKDPQKTGPFVAAHETGHADSLHDEYIEAAANASYLSPGLEDFIPGSPYDADRGAIMSSNEREPRPRHYWHAAEWLNAMYGFPFEVKLGNFRFRLPANPDFPKTHRSFLTWPMFHAFNSESGTIPDRAGNKIGSGKYDLYIYPLGNEKYVDEILPHGKGLPGGRVKAMLVVVVKMVFTFPQPSSLQRIFRGMLAMGSGVRHRFNESQPLFFTSAARADLSPCLIHFSPRVLVRNFAPGSPGMNVTNQQDYNNKVKDILDRNGFHFEIELRDSGNSQWIRSSSSGLLLTFQTDTTTQDSSLATEFPRFFANMAGVDGRNEGATDDKINDAASYRPIVTKLIPDAVVHRMP